MNSLLTVQNVGDEEDNVTIEFAYNGRSFVLPEIPLQPKEARTLNLRALVTAGLTDRSGVPLPSNALEGGYRITSSNRFTGKIVTKEQILSSTGRIAMPFYSVCDYVTALYFNNAPSTMTLSVSQSQTVFPVCDWNYGTTAATDASVWISNTSKATVSPSSGASRTVTAVGVGQTSLQSTASAPEQIGPDECEPGFFEAPPITVVVEIVDLEGSLENIPVSSDGQAVIAHQNFTLRVEAVHPTTGQRITTYNGSATVSFGTLKSGESISPNPVQLTNGVGTTTVKLRGVNSTGDAGRPYTLAGPPLAPYTGSVNLWFQVHMDAEFWKDCDFTQCPNLGSYYCQTKCEPSGYAQKTEFVALTDDIACDRNVKVRQTASSAIKSSIVRDEGPVKNTPYWTTGITPPSVAGCLTDKLLDSLGMSNGCSGGVAFGGGSILWRFQ